MGKKHRVQRRELTDELKSMYFSTCEFWWDEEIELCLRPWVIRSAFEFYFEGEGLILNNDAVFGDFDSVQIDRCFYLRRADYYGPAVIEFRRASP